MTDRIFLRGVQVHGRHGLFEEERRLGQRFVFDVDVWLDLSPSARSDDLAQSVSYAEIHDVVVEFGAGEPVSLLETLAENIAQALLSRFPAIEQARVEAHKPSAPIAGIFSDVGVEIVRRRG